MAQLKGNRMNALPRIVVRNGKTGYVLGKSNGGTYKVRTFKEVPNLEGFPAKVVGTEQVSRIEHWPVFDSTPVQW